MPLPVLPSKLVWERVRVEFDFADQLEFNETITSWNVEVFVNSGTDPAPEDMIATRRFQDGARLFQWIIGGVPGNIYRLVNTATGSSGRVYKLEKVLAIIPSLFVFPPLFGVTFTTPPYAVEAVESLNMATEPRSGYSITPPVDELDMVTFPLFGELRLPLITYSMLPEGLDMATLPTLGSLVTPLQVYTIPAEGLDMVTFPPAGDLKTVLINYPNWPAEGLDMATSPLSGELV